MEYSKVKIPRHVGIILDGNGRWAKEKGMNRSEGHKEGAKNLKSLGIYILSKGVKVVSIYAFSSENFKRSKEEVSFLMNLFTTKFSDELNGFHDENIKVVFSGRRENLPKKLLKVMDDLTEKTKYNDGGILNVCLNYSARNEIIDMVKRIKDDNIDNCEIDELLINKYMYNDLPDIDFLIRTSNEQRLSNFMLWQLSYAELYFTKTYFPDFKTDEFDKAILEYTKRDRRFGNIDYTK
ncbi:MAG: undecaprenyl pyrophosphate synthase [Clostridia bacterium]|nr:undecaprenyl pyrophosphate synthase [Clostridia bacterium]